MAIDISKKQKEKIYKEFDAALYREFNEGLDDLRAALDIDEQGLLDEALEGTFEDGGPKELRKFIDDSLEWIQEKNLKILFSIILLIIFGILAQLEIIPKLIT